MYFEENDNFLAGIIISDTIKELLPDIRLGCFKADVEVGPSSDELIQYTDEVINNMKKRLTIKEVSQIKVIAETKDAYRRLGKDPTRYRPSAEALTRRVLQGKKLYQINKIVDALNLVSIKTGYSIGGYDQVMIKEEIVLGIGATNEPYEAIGRGMLNIENLPVLRDANGAFGSPTSDSHRTMVGENTRNFLMILFDFMNSGQLKASLEEAEHVFSVYCGTTKMESWII